MKFIPDGPKLKIVPETHSEELWVASLKESSRRVKPGSEHFVLRAFKAWSTGVSLPVPAAQKKAQAEKADRRAERIASKEKEVHEWASRLFYDLDVREGLSGKQEVGALVSAANELAQLSGHSLELAGIPWTARPQAIIEWLG
jgi:hypothetical protein